MSQERKEYFCWKKWMELGEKTGCHQRPDRSFFLKGYQVPVCARCSGVFFGYISGMVFWALGKKHIPRSIISIIGCYIMFFDWLLQALKIKESTNKRRFITGFFGGMGLIIGYIEVIKWLIDRFRKK